VAAAVTGADMDSGFGLRTMSDRMAGYQPLSYHCGSVWPHDTAIVVHGLVDVPYFKNDLSLEFWVLLALGYAATLNLPAPSGTRAQAFFLRRRDQSPNRLSRSLPLDSRAWS